ncbi:MAG: hypothetical protein R3309_05000 [Reinekea sp.]|jgi:hypothetical protein|nr:hypothetical protein [Reinekea sp.]
MKLKLLTRIVAVLQIVLGLAYLFIPVQFLAVMGHSLPPGDLLYPLGMLASRFLVVGIVFWYIAPHMNAHRLWVDAMIAIQIIDLAVGVSMTLTDAVPLSLSGFPMFNALIIAVLLFVWRPAKLHSTLTSAAL